ncbi:MAG: GAF domain-containing protein [Armatimonadota bacterium]
MNLYEDEKIIREEKKVLGLSFNWIYVISLFILSMFFWALYKSKQPWQSFSIPFESAVCASLFLSASYYLCSYSSRGGKSRFFAGCAYSIICAGFLHQLLVDTHFYSGFPDDFVLSASLLFGSVSLFCAGFVLASDDDRYSKIRNLRKYISLVCLFIFPVLVIAKWLYSGMIGSHVAFWYNDSFSLSIFSNKVVAAFISFFLLISYIKSYKTGWIRSTYDLVFLSSVAFTSIFWIAAQARFDNWWWAGMFTIFMGALVQISGFAAESVMRGDSVRSRYSYLQMLYLASENLFSTNNPFVNISKTLDSLIRYEDIHTITLFIKSDKDELEVAACSSRSDDCNNIGERYSISSDKPIGFHTGHTSKAFRTGKVQYAKDINADIEFISWRTVAQTNGYAVSIPVVKNDEILGVLSVYFAFTNYVDAEKVNVFITITNMLANVVDAYMVDNVHYIDYERDHKKAA